MNIIKHKIQSSSGQAQQIEDGQQQLLPNHMGTIDRPSSSLVDTGSGFDMVAGHALRSNFKQIIAAGRAIGLKSFGPDRFVQGFDLQQKEHSTKRDENQWLRKVETMIVNTFNEHNYAVKLQN